MNRSNLMVIYNVQVREYERDTLMLRFLYLQESEKKTKSTMKYLENRTNGDFFQLQLICLTINISYRWEHFGLLFYHLKPR